MKRSILACMFLSVVTCAGVVSGSVVFWDTADGGNGHFYEAVVVETEIAWQDAKLAAEVRGGYLATITTEIENDVVVSVVTNSNYWPWLGGFQYDKLAEPAGHWAWVTGETWDYTNWGTADPEPNDAYGHEEFLVFGNSDGQWNDLAGFGWGVRSYAVEYDSYSGPFDRYNPPGGGDGGNNVVPEASSLAVWSVLSMVGIGYGQWRKRRPV